MKRRISRLIALLLIPCLLVDSAQAFTHTASDPSALVADTVSRQALVALARQFFWQRKMDPQGLSAEQMREQAQAQAAVNGELPNTFEEEMASMGLWSKRAETIGVLGKEPGAVTSMTLPTIYQNEFIPDSILNLYKSGNKKKINKLLQIAMAGVSVHENISTHETVYIAAAMDLTVEKLRARLSDLDVSESDLSSWIDHDLPKPQGLPKRRSRHSKTIGGLTLLFTVLAGVLSSAATAAAQTTSTVGAAVQSAAQTVLPTQAYTESIVEHAATFTKVFINSGSQISDAKMGAVKALNDLFHTGAVRYIEGKGYWLMEGKRLLIPHDIIPAAPLDVLPSSPLPGFESLMQLPDTVTSALAVVPMSPTEMLAWGLYALAVIIAIVKVAQNTKIFQRSPEPVRAPEKQRAPADGTKRTTEIFVDAQILEDRILLGDGHPSALEAAIRRLEVAARNAGLYDHERQDVRDAIAARIQRLYDALDEKPISRRGLTLNPPEKSPALSWWESFELALPYAVTLGVLLLFSRMANVFIGTTAAFATAYAFVPMNFLWQKFSLGIVPQVAADDVRTKEASKKSPVLLWREILHYLGVRPSYATTKLQPVEASNETDFALAILRELEGKSDYETARSVPQTQLTVKAITLLAQMAPWPWTEEKTAQWREQLHELSLAAAGLAPAPGPKSLLRVALKDIATTLTAIERLAALNSQVIAPVDTMGAPLRPDLVLKHVEGARRELRTILSRELPDDELSEEEREKERSKRTGSVSSDWPFLWTNLVAYARIVELDIDARTWVSVDGVVRHAVPEVVPESEAVEEKGSIWSWLRLPRWGDLQPTFTHASVIAATLLMGGALLDFVRPSNLLQRLTGVAVLDAQISPLTDEERAAWNAIATTTSGVIPFENFYARWVTKDYIYLLADGIRSLTPSKPFIVNTRTFSRVLSLWGKHPRGKIVVNADSIHLDPEGLNITLRLNSQGQIVSVEVNLEALSKAGINVSAYSREIQPVTILETPLDIPVLLKNKIDADSKTPPIPVWAGISRIHFDPIAGSFVALFFGLSPTLAFVAALAAAVLVWRHARRAHPDYIGDYPANSLGTSAWRALVAFIVTLLLSNHWQNVDSSPEHLSKPVTLSEEMSTSEAPKPTPQSQPTPGNASSAQVQQNLPSTNSSATVEKVPFVGPLLPIVKPAAEEIPGMSVPVRTKIFKTEGVKQDGLPLYFRRHGEEIRTETVDVSEWAYIDVAVDRPGSADVPNYIFQFVSNSGQILSATNDRGRLYTFVLIGKNVTSGYVRAITENEGFESITVGAQGYLAPAQKNKIPFLGFLMGMAAAVFPSLKRLGRDDRRSLQEVLTAA